MAVAVALEDLASDGMSDRCKAKDQNSQLRMDDGLTLVVVASCEDSGGYSRSDRVG
jgi:hypothetical protein